MQNCSLNCLSVTSCFAEVQILCLPMLRYFLTTETIWQFIRSKWKAKRLMCFQFCFNVGWKFFGFLSRRSWTTSTKSQLNLREDIPKKAAVLLDFIHITSKNVSLKIGSRGPKKLGPFVSLFLMRKPLSSGQKLFLRPYFPLIRGIFLLKSGLRFSFQAPEVLKMRVRKRPLSLSKVAFSSLSIPALLLLKTKTKTNLKSKFTPNLLEE